MSGKIANQMKYTYCILKNKFFFDEVFDRIFVKTTKHLSNWSRKFDIKIIDRFGPNGFSITTRGFSWCMCQIQTGYIFNYAFYIIFAIVVCITVFVAKYLFGA